jgi:hypothetical protein
MTIADPLTNLDGFIDRYLAVWHEPDPDARRRSVQALWADDAEHYTATIEARGHAEIATRVAGAYERFVQPGTYRFRSAGDQTGHHRTAAFHWEMVATADEELAGRGLDVFVFDDEGRVRSHYQYAAPVTPPGR